MEISLDTYLLCSSNLAVGQVGPSGMSLNGDSIVDPVPFFRALAIVYFARGGEKVEWQFRVQRDFSTARLAQRFAILHRTQIPRQGRVKVTVGVTGDTEDIYLEDAIVQPSIVAIVGQSVTVQYAITGGIPSTDVPDALPSADPEEEEVSFRRGSVTIDEDAETVAVEFSSELASAPTTIIPHVSHGTGEDAIDCELLQDTITDSGFTVKLSAPCPAGTYKLHYTAFL